METIYFDDRTRTSTAAANPPHDELRAAANTEQLREQPRGAAREIPKPDVDLHGQQPWVAHANPAGYRRTEQGWTPGRCSCGRRPVQRLDSRQGPKTVPYCGRPLGDHHGPEIEAAVWQTPEPIEPAAGEAQSWEDKTPGAEPEPTTLASWLADDIDEYPPPRIERVGDIHGQPAGGDR